VRVRLRWLVIVPLLAGLILLVDRRSTDPPPHEAEWLSADDVQVRVVRAGTGDTTVVLFHGYAESLMAFRPMFDQLAARTSVVAVDLPGFGLSDKPRAPYDLASYVRRMTAFIDRHVPGPIVLVGHSLGGEVAAAVALERPGQVVGLVLIASAGWGLSPATMALAQEGAEVMGWINSVVGELVVPLHDPAWLAEPKERRRYDPLLDPAFRAASARVLKEFDFEALQTRFGDIRQPTLLIWGERDPTIPFAFGKAIDEAIECSRMMTIRRTLHRPHQTEPGVVAQAIEHFLDDPPTCPPGSSPSEETG
jgi:pimeloyl-ACP methyl ester carboxylesterase